MTRALALGLSAGVGAVFVMASSCGGDAVVDGGGNGGMSATSGSSTTGSAGQGGDADCDVLFDELADAFEAAVLCDPSMSVPQCSGQAIIKNRCGCDWAGNDLATAEVAAAQVAWAAVQDADCDAPCPGPCPDQGAHWACTHLPIGTDGTCELVD